jgi:dTDP-4-dehydrorhamnose 3,5-epimerase
VFFEPLQLSGAFRILPDRKEDARGHFARTFCAREFAAAGLNPALAQANTSFNRACGTLRGLHWQAEPHGEDKLVRATRGAVWDVLVDLRPESPTFRKWHGEILSAENGIQLYIPRGFAHGFVTLEDDSEVFYLMSEFFVPESARGARFDDPAFAIDWPLREGLILSDRDRAFPLFLSTSPLAPPSGL